MTVHTGADGKMKVGPLSNDRSILRRQVSQILLRFRLEGRQVTKCPPAFAYGVETPSSVRQMIRKGW